MSRAIVFVFNNQITQQTDQTRSLSVWDGPKAPLVAVCVQLTQGDLGAPPVDWSGLCYEGHAEPAAESTCGATAAASSSAAPTATTGRTVRDILEPGDSNAAGAAELSTAQWQLSAGW